MAGETMALISTLTVGAGGATYVDLTSIPQSFTDLVLYISSKDNRTDQNISNIFINLNISGTGTYVSKQLYGLSNAVGSDSSTSFYGNSSGSGTTSIFGNCVAYFHNYASTSSTKYISWDAVTEVNGAVGWQVIGGGNWNQNTAISSVRLTPISAPFAQYSTFSLYGILKGSGGATVS